MEELIIRSLRKSIVPANKELIKVSDNHFRYFINGEKTELLIDCSSNIIALSKRVFVQTSTL